MGAKRIDIEKLSAKWELCMDRPLGHSHNSMRNARRALTYVAAATTATARGLRQRATARAGYNESELGDFVDREDEAIYAEAVRIFRRNLARYG